MYISRKLEHIIIDHISTREEILVIYGARQVGKSTLINKVLDDMDLRVLRINGEELRYQRIFSGQDLRQMQQLTEGYQALFIDEAQNIENIGINIKILFDARPKLKIILSGSSSFELANKVKEPLTGRTRTLLLYPLAFSELKSIYNEFELKEYLNEYLVLGGYPGPYRFANKNQKIKALGEMASAYLYKDVLIFAQLRHSKKLFDLLRLLAFQIGNTVSIHELSKSLNTSSETVERYIDLLEKSFVVFRLSGYSGNLRKEITKMDKIFFYDVGIRNAIISDFSDISDRNDVGQLWENFLVAERLKLIEYNQWIRQSFFWRTYSGVELDYVETQNRQMKGYEFKWGKKLPKPPRTWIKYYPTSDYQVINRDNFFDFIM